MRDESVQVAEQRNSYLTPRISYLTLDTLQIMKECCVACSRAYCTRADILPTAAEHVRPHP